MVASVEKGWYPISIFAQQGEINMKFKTGDTEYPFYIDVSESGIDLQETTDGLVLKLSAAGRSNSESDPGAWDYGDIHTTFEGFDWNSNGWTGDALKLTGGAKIEIGYSVAPVLNFILISPCCVKRLVYVCVVRATLTDCVCTPSR